MNTFSRKAQTFTNFDCSPPRFCLVEDVIFHPEAPLLITFINGLKVDLD